MLGKSGRLFVVLAHCHSSVGTTYQLPPDPVLKIYHMALRAPLLVLPNSLLWQRVCDLSNPCLLSKFLLFQTNLFSKTSFPLSFSSFSLPLWWSRQGCSSPQSFKSCIPSSPPSAPLYFPKFAFFTFTFFLRLLFCCQSTNSASI